ncbi:MAG: carbohydrate kinase family protein [Kiritimatiellae bacterium]|nr:carbohydrate kinase family protein [Kiritimatiellia bacterium]
MNSIAFCGSLIVDEVKIIKSWPTQGMLVQIESLSRAVGGSVCNTGIDLKTLDPSIDVKAIGKVGCDDKGDFIVKTLSARGLDVSGIERVNGTPTSFTDVMTVAGTGERTFFNMHGADSMLKPSDVNLASLNCDILHFGYILLLDGMDESDSEYGTKAARLLAEAQKAGIKTSIDVVSEQSERFARIVRPALKYCDYAIVNEVEGSLATGADKSDIRAICEGLLSLGVRERVAVHCPEVGATMSREGDFTQVPSLSLPQGWIRGSVGAGDAFCAGMLYAIMKGLSPEESLRLASCTAACNLSAPDSISGAKSLAETMALDSQFPRRA